MKNIYFGLGSNLGNRFAHLEKAVILLSNEFKMIKLSSIYETAPIGYLDQGYFLNQVVMIESEKPIEDVLRITQKLEILLERKRDFKWGPRTIDIDLLLSNREYINKPYLKIPHPELRNRRFVLEPLFEIDPDLVVPPDDIPVRKYLEDVQHQKIIKLERQTMDQPNL